MHETLTVVHWGKGYSYPLLPVRTQEQRGSLSHLPAVREHPVWLREVYVEGSSISLIFFPKLLASSARSRLLFNGLVNEFCLKVIVSPTELIISYTSCFCVCVLSAALSSPSFLLLAKALVTACLFPAVYLLHMKSVSIPAPWHRMLIGMATFTGSKSGFHSVFYNTNQAIVWNRFGFCCIWNVSTLFA